MSLLEEIIEQQRLFGLTHPQQGALRGLLGGYSPLAYAMQPMQQQQQQTEPVWPSYGGQKPISSPLSFIDKLRVEIDNWLKS